MKNSEAKDLPVKPVLLDLIMVLKQRKLTLWSLVAHTDKSESNIILQKIGVKMAEPI
jgi:hypothetical protein